jgi:WD40 repeat protein
MIGSDRFPIEFTVWKRGVCPLRPCSSTAAGASTSVPASARARAASRFPSASGSAAGGPGGEVKVWDAQTGQELFTLKGGGLGHGVVFSPNGHWLLSYGGSTVKIYDATPLPEKPKP